MSRHVEINSSWTGVECRALGIESGTTVLMGIVTRARFRIQWPNPLWEIAGLDFGAQDLYILAQLDQAIAASGPLDDPHPFSDNGLKAAAQLYAAPPHWSDLQW